MSRSLLCVTVGELMRGKRIRRVLGAFVLVSTLAAVALVVSKISRTDHVTGKLADGATYVMDVPANWNKTIAGRVHTGSWPSTSAREMNSRGD